MANLWELVEKTAKMVRMCQAFIDMRSIDAEEADPAVGTVGLILSNSIDNLEALKFLSLSEMKTKKNTDVTEFARQAMQAYKESKKIIK